MTHVTVEATPTLEDVHIAEVRKRIADSTCSNMGYHAVRLFDNICALTSPSDDIPTVFGATALDVGARDGRYVPVIRELGLTRITAIDPSDELNVGIEHGILEPEEVFFGTAEDYLEHAKGEQVDTVFALNIAPHLLNGNTFTDAIMKLVKPGGLVVASCIERDTYDLWRREYDWTRRLKPTFFATRQSQQPMTDKSPLNNEHIVMERGGTANHFLTIGRRTLQNA